MFHTPHFLVKAGSAQLTDILTTDLIADWDPALGCVDGEGETSTNETGIYQWTDQEGSLVAEQGSSGDQPIWMAGGNTNGTVYPFVDFPGLEFMEVLNSNTSFTQDALTVYAVLDLQGTPGTYDTLFHRGSDNYWDNGWRVGTDGSNNWEAFVIDEAYEASNTNATNAREVKVMRFNLNTPIIQTIDQTKTTATATPSGSNNTPNKNALLGASWNSSGTDGTFFIDGYLFRFLIYDAYHSDSDMGLMVDFLKKKYVDELI